MIKPVNRVVGVCSHGDQWGKFLGKFAVKRILKIPTHLAYVATLPCDTLKVSDIAVAFHHRLQLRIEDPGKEVSTSDLWHHLPFPWKYFLGLVTQTEFYKCLYSRHRLTGHISVFSQNNLSTFDYRQCHDCYSLAIIVIHVIQ